MPSTTCPAVHTPFLSLEDRLFAWDADESTRCADAFVRQSLRGGVEIERKPIPLRVPEAPGSYARLGGETVIVRANDLALTMAARLRAA